MSEELIVLLEVVAVLAAAALVAKVLMYAMDQRHPLEVPGAVPASEIIARENACHPAPSLPYTADEAHMVWRARIDCDADTCADKNAALRVLIAAGRVRPTAQLDRRTR